MLRKRSFAVLGFVTVGCAHDGRGSGVRTEPLPLAEVVVRAQSADEEFDYLWQQLGQMEFFRAHGYSVAIPNIRCFSRSLRREPSRPIVRRRVTSSPARFTIRRATRQDSVVQELAHIGIERPIVQRFHLTHEEKERLVDRICLQAFRTLLPDYHAQPMGPAALHAFIDDAALQDLPAAISRYVSENPRAPEPVGP